VLLVEGPERVEERHAAWGEHGAHKGERGIRAIATIEPVAIPEAACCDHSFILTASSCKSMIAHRSVEVLE
jgi:hypothetical protein